MKFGITTEHGVYNEVEASNVPEAIASLYHHNKPDLAEIRRIWLSRYNDDIYHAIYIQEFEKNMRYWKVIYPLGEQ